MISLAPTPLISFESTTVDIPGCQNSTVIGLIEMEISIPILILTWIPWKKLNLPPRSALRNF